MTINQLISFFFTPSLQQGNIRGSIIKNVSGESPVCFLTLYVLTFPALFILLTSSPLAAPLNEIFSPLHVKLKLPSLERF